MTTKSSFRMEKLTKIPPKNSENRTYLAAAGYAAPKSALNATRAISNNITVKTCMKPKKE